MSYLAEILDKVRQSDLSVFREKIEAAEKGRKEELISRDLLDLDMIVAGRQEKIMLDAGVEKELEKEPQQSQETGVDADVFAKFLQSIRG